VLNKDGTETVLPGRVLRDLDAAELNGKVWLAMKDRIPGYGKNLPPSRGPFGEVRYTGGSWGPDWISPLYRADGASTRYLAAQHLQENDVSMGRPRPIFHYEGGQVDLREIHDDRGRGFAFDRYQELMGEARLTAVRMVLQAAGVSDSQKPIPKEFSSVIEEAQPGAMKALRTEIRAAARNYRDLPVGNTAGTRGELLQRTLDSFEEAAKVLFYREYRSELDRMLSISRDYPVTINRPFPDIGFDQ